MTNASPPSLRPITRWLAAAPPAVLAAYAIACSFATYFAMFAFRKPFAAASYNRLAAEGSSLGLKSALVIGQVVGYGLAKWIGVKFVSETGRSRRAPLLVLMIVAAEAALALFAVVPDGWRPLAMFLNGLPLGMVWGLVVWYLEGRRASEVLLAGLSCSFIIAGGAVQDVGRAVLAGDALPLLGLTFPNPFGRSVDELWMPFAVGALFLLPFVVSVWLLDQLPEPTAADVAARSVREPMSRRQRLEFLRHFLPGLLGLFAAYFFITAFRDFRDNFIVDLFAELNYPYEQNKSIVTRSVLWIGLGVAAAMAMIYFVRDNRRGLMAVFGVIIGGLLLVGGATWLHARGRIDGFWWMTLIGLGSYLAYVPYGSVLFERLIASTRVAGTAVFAIYVADSLGYVGTVSMLLYKDFGASGSSRLEFLQAFAYALSLAGAAGLLLAAIYFRRVTRTPASIDEQR
jgi:MFS family permease